MLRDIRPHYAIVTNSAIESDRRGPVLHAVYPSSANNSLAGVFRYEKEYRKLVEGTHGEELL